MKKERVTILKGHFCALWDTVVPLLAFSSVSRLLPPKGFILHSLSLSFNISGVDFFPALILRWLGLICMHLHNESHLHAQGRLYHENRHEKVCVCVCARMPNPAYALTC